MSEWMVCKYCGGLDALKPEGGGNCERCMQFRVLYRCPRRPAHTPGPWVWEFHPQHPGKVIALVDDRHHHADVLLCTGTGEEAWGDI
jgi:hypothetical protein